MITSTSVSSDLPEWAWTDVGRAPGLLESPTSFWAGLAPFAILTAALLLAGQTFWAVVTLGTFVAAATLLAPQVGIYLALVLQAWDPIFIRPEFSFEVLGVITPTKILSFVVLAGYLLVPRERKFPVQQTRACMVLFLGLGLWGCLLIATAPDRAVAWRQSSQALVLLGVCVVAVRLIRTPRQIARLATCAVVGSVSASIGVLLSGESAITTRGTLGEYSNPNTTALALGVGMMCIPAAWGLTRAKLMWVVHGASAALVMTGIMMTGSRAACAAVVVAYSIGGLLTKSPGLAKKIAAAVFASAFGVAVFFAVLEAHILDRKSQERLEALVYGGEAFTADSRRFIWRDSVKTLVARPLFGSGFGNTAHAMAEAVPGMARDAHSNYLAVPIEAGVIGALLFFAALAELTRRTWRIPTANPGIPAMIMTSYVLLSGATHTTYVTKWFWFPVAVSWVLIEYGHSPQNPLLQREPQPSAA